MAVGSGGLVGDENLSFFSGSQLNPGVIEPPKSRSQHLHSDLSVQGEEKLKQQVLKEKQEGFDERRMKYTEDLRLNIQQHTQPEPNSGSERLISSYYKIFHSCV